MRRRRSPPAQPRRRAGGPRGTGPSAEGGAASADDGDRTTSWFLRWPLPILLVATGLVYLRVLWAGFVTFDDDFHVYANPFLNPPTLQSVGRFWARAYEQLYVPVAYTIFAGIARVAQIPAHLDGSTGQTISLDPAAFHGASVALHVANAGLCFALIRRLTGRARAAWLCALLFALHPLQLESVGWISELRGLASAGFSLSALLVLVRLRQAVDPARSAIRLVVSALLLACAMLCKPSAAALPLVALAIDRIVFRTPWRRALVVTTVWGAVVLPLVLVTHATQAVPVAGQSAWWQRPFIAGHALAFYLFKTVVPIDLCVDYGWTPTAVMSQAWGYLAWIVPAALLWVGYRRRLRRPMTWLGALLFVSFLLPTLGLVPFAYQAYSTVADRYAYLALLGVGLVAADLVERVKAEAAAMRAAVAALGALAMLTFVQSRHWRSGSDLLRHTIDVNPAAGFAYNNLGDIELGNGDLAAARADYQAGLEREPTLVKARINLAEVQTALGQPVDAERAIDEALRAPAKTPDDLSNLGVALMKMDRPVPALQALADAVSRDPLSPTYLFNHANALAAVGRLEEAEAVFRRCIAVAPTLAGAHTGLGVVLAETHHLAEAIAEFRTAVQLQPSDPAALDNLKRAEGLMRPDGRPPD
jgi:tetratricopeptide (TPR) repeat protein